MSIDTYMLRITHVGDGNVKMGEPIMTYFYLFDTGFQDSVHKSLNLDIFLQNKSIVPYRLSSKQFAIEYSKVLQTKLDVIRHKVRLNNLNILVTGLKKMLWNKEYFVRAVPYDLSVYFRDKEKLQEQISTQKEMLNRATIVFLDDQYVT